MRSAGFRAYPLQNHRVAEGDIVEETPAPPRLASSLSRSGVGSTLSDAPSVMSHYLQDVRQYPLLTHQHELILARQIQEGGNHWRQAFVQSLLLVPDLLACRSRVRRGAMHLSALCGPAEPGPADPEHPAEPGNPHVPELDVIMATLDRLQHVRREVGRSTAGGVPVADTVAAWRDEMRALIQPLPWHPSVLQQAWCRLHQAMTSSLVRQQRQVRRYGVSLGYTVATVRDLWGHLDDLYTQVDTAKQAMITRNLRLVISVAREFLHTGLPLTDLVQEGNIGLMRAVDKFDHRRNLKFSTYAVWWIKQAMRRAVYDQMGLIRVPEYMHESARQVQKVIPLLTTELGRDPTPGEMAQRLDLPLERVERSLALTPEPMSLDHMQPGVRDRPFQELVADTEAVQGLDSVLQHDLQAQTQQALACLKPREAEVLRRRFGLDGQPGETLRQIGLYLQLSHERVRQIEAQALAKLKVESPNLRDYLDG